jgi:hypothetical protein
VSGLEDRRLTRRDLMAADAGVAVGAALAGCGIGRGIQGDVNRRIEPKVDATSTTSTTPSTSIPGS